MALQPRYTNLAVNTKVDAESALADGGKLRIYTGVQPTTADTPITVQVMLVEFTNFTPAFAAGVSGVATFNPIAPAVAVQTGVPTWFRQFKADGITPLWDGSAGTVNANCLVSFSPIVLGATVTVLAYSRAEPKG